MAISPAQAIGRSAPPSKPKLAIEAMLARGEASFASAAPASTMPSPTRKMISTIPPCANLPGRTGAFRSGVPRLLQAAPPFLAVVEALALLVPRAAVACPRSQGRARCAGPAAAAEDRGGRDTEAREVGGDQ